MPLPAELAGVSGAQELFDFFGYWPRFHDAHLLSLELNPTGISKLRLHTWEMTREVDERGFFKLTKEVTVELALERVVDAQLDGFSDESTLMELGLTPKLTGYKIEMDDVRGFFGQITAERVSISIIPGRLQTRD